MRRGVSSYAGWVLVAVAAGCHHPGRPAAAPPAPAELPVVARRAAEPDVAAVPPLPTPTRPPTGRRLTAAECRTLAVRNAPLADDLDRHPDNATPNAVPCLCHGKADRAACGRAVRGYAADELRNRAAGDALDDFFKLARAEAQFDLLAAARAEVAARLADADAAAKQGFRDRADALRGQLHDLDAKLADLGGGLGALTAALRGRLGLDAADPLPLAPADPLRVRGEDADAAAAVRAGLHFRPDLNLLRALLACPERSGLSGTVLGGINPLLAAGTGHPVVALLLAVCGKDDGSRERLESALASRERQAEAEIRAAVAVVNGRRVAAAARSAAVADAAARVDDLEKRAAAGQAVAAELSTARLDLLTARGALLEAAADWCRAEAKLRQAMGVLVRE